MPVISGVAISCSSARLQGEGVLVAGDDPGRLERLRDAEAVGAGVGGRVAARVVVDLGGPAVERDRAGLGGGVGHPRDDGALDVGLVVDRADAGVAGARAELALVQDGDVRGMPDRCQLGGGRRDRVGQRPGVVVDVSAEQLVKGQRGEVADLVQGGAPFTH
jgi:hypothetical protein